MERLCKDFHSYIMGKRIAIIGAGTSNSPLVRLFYHHQCQSVTVRDRKEISSEARAVFEQLGAEVVCGEGYLDEVEADLVIRTPGLRPDHPTLNRLREQGARVVGETQLFLQFAPCKVFGVTGSDGKTTTTTLISKLLETTGKRVFLGGNIGTPLLPLIDQITEDDFACLELSSFQLMDGEYSPNVSVITNVTENHLDWHTDMEEYARAKKQIFLHQSDKDVLIINSDDPRTAAFASEARGECRSFSLVSPQSNGTYLENARLTLCKKGQQHDFFAKGDIRIPGLYNVANFLAAICATADYVSPEAAREVAMKFPGVEHRVEWIRKNQGVNYYNSSIDSSPSRTIATLGAFSTPLTVICGGYDKNLDYSGLKPHFYAHVKEVHVTGQTADKIIQAISASDAPYTVYRHDSLQEAFLSAKELAQEGDTIILSPASASFDSFKNFEERGRFFKELVKAL